MWKHAKTELAAMEFLLRRADRFENLEDGILFEQVGRETEHSAQGVTALSHEWQE